jgi:hypothetical protein
LYKKQKLLRLTGLYMLRRPMGGLGSVRLGHSAALHSHASLRHILPALAFAAQSPYSGWQNVIYSRNVMCSKPATERRAWTHGATSFPLFVLSFQYFHYFIVSIYKIIYNYSIRCFLQNFIH